MRVSPMQLPRASGLLFHPTSLPGPYGIGDIGPEAVRFADLLAETGQFWWQMLPITPVGAGYSPYSGTSTFAGNFLLISPDMLVEEGYIKRSDLDGLEALDPGRADYESAARVKNQLLRIAFDRFELGSGPGEARIAYEEFCEAESSWLTDYALHEAIRGASGGLSASDWPDRDLAHRDPDALRRVSAKLGGEIRYTKFVQFVFDQQWTNFRQRVRAKGISLIGDLPLFVSAESADVWVHPELFHVDDDLRATLVSGVPPDHFQKDGQLWGNPLYLWDTHLKDNFSWWIARIRGALRRFDLIRIDHFRGFNACFAIPGDAKTARDPRSRWEPAPGLDLFAAISDALGPHLPFIAEDLGIITPGVQKLREAFSLPGMRVLQFAFGNDPLADYYLPHSYVPHSVVYTGTHDNDTTLGWLTSAPGSTTQTAEQLAAERAFVRRYLRLPTNAPAGEVVKGLLHAAWASVSRTAIAPLQDWLLLGSEARMNIPGTETGNWMWRADARQLTIRSLDDLAESTATTNRWNGAIPSSLQTRLPSPMHPTEHNKPGTSDEQNVGGALDGSSGTGRTHP